MFQTCQKGRRNVLIEAVEQRRERVGALTSEGGGNGMVRIEDAGDCLVRLSLLLDHHLMAAVAEQHGLRAPEKLRQSQLVRGGNDGVVDAADPFGMGRGNIASVNQSAQSASGGRTVSLLIMVNQRVGIPVASHCSDSAFCVDS